MSCTSGFTDDVTFGCNEPYGDSGVAIPGRSLMSTNALFIKVVCINITNFVKFC